MFHFCIYELASGEWTLLNKAQSPNFEQKISAIYRPQDALVVIFKVDLEICVVVHTN